jgi:bifunctional non-homologous end joining protein LigD
MEKDNPKLYLTKMTKAARAGKIYLDYLRNERGATSVAPYSPRARAGMPVSLPLNWSELTSQSSVRPRFLVSKFAEWKKRLARDPWKTMIGKKQHLILVESK